LAKILNFVLPTEKRLVVSFWTFFKYLGNHSELEKNETTKNFVDAGAWASAAGGRGWPWPPLDFHTWYRFCRRSCAGVSF